MAESSQGLEISLCGLSIHPGQPRAAVGFSFGLLLALLTRLSLIPDPGDELAGAITAMRKQQASLQADVPVVQQPRQARSWSAHRALGDGLRGRYARAGRPALEDADQRAGQSLGTV